MNAPDRKRNGILAKAWDDYGHSIPWEDLVDMKVGQHGYVALAWRESDGLINYADLASPEQGVWEIQNDSHEPMTEARWKAARVKPDCDWLIFKGEEE